MTSIQESAEAGKVAGLIEDFMKLHDEMVKPTPEDIAEVEERTRLLIADEMPEKIAGSLVFFRLSRLLYHEGRLAMTELSEKLTIEKYSATRLVSWYVEKGLAERSGEPHDRRVVKVALTEKGRQFYEIIESIITTRILRVLQRLTVEEQDVFLNLFQKLASGKSPNNLA